MCDPSSSVPADLPSQELHDLEMTRDGSKMQAGLDQQEMVAKAARSVGLQVLSSLLDALLTVAAGAG